MNRMAAEKHITIATSRDRCGSRATWMTNATEIALAKIKYLKFKYFSIRVCIAFDKCIQKLFPLFIQSGKNRNVTIHQPLTCRAQLSTLAQTSNENDINIIFLHTEKIEVSLSAASFFDSIFPVCTSTSVSAFEASKNVLEPFTILCSTAYSIRRRLKDWNLANSIGKLFSWAHSTRWKWRRTAIHHRSIQADDVDENEIEMKVYLSRKSIHDYPLAYYSIRRRKKLQAQHRRAMSCTTVSLFFLSLSLFFSGTEFRWHSHMNYDNFTSSHWQYETDFQLQIIIIRTKNGVNANTMNEKRLGNHEIVFLVTFMKSE